MTAVVVEKNAKVTAQGQTTVPASIRERLGVRPGDTITFSVDGDGNVMLRRAEEGDPAISAFLEFLSNDIQRNPAGLRPVTASLERRLRRLTRATVIDRDKDCITVDVGL
ncbi:MAG TPA: type II toxin-antitoxin system PrlF family antitoxin [Allosphingosinicella sp.]|nr:type II toxin-antitoxin system PrlF family antitoxin [Allosphingosinicella sp.]